MGGSDDTPRAPQMPDVCSSSAASSPDCSAVSPHVFDSSGASPGRTALSLNASGSASPVSASPASAMRGPTASETPQLSGKTADSAQPSWASLWASYASSASVAQATPLPGGGDRVLMGSPAPPSARSAATAPFSFRLGGGAASVTRGDTQLTINEYNTPGITARLSAELQLHRLQSPVEVHYNRLSPAEAAVAQQSPSFRLAPGRDDGAAVDGPEGPASSPMQIAMHEDGAEADYEAGADAFVYEGRGPPSSQVATAAVARALARVNRLSRENQVCDQPAEGSGGGSGYAQQKYVFLCSLYCALFWGPEAHQHPVPTNRPTASCWVLTCPPTVNCYPWTAPSMNCPRAPPNRNCSTTWPRHGRGDSRPTRCSTWLQW